MDDDFDILAVAAKLDIAIGVLAVDQGAVHIHIGSAGALRQDGKGLRGCPLSGHGGSGEPAEGDVSGRAVGDHLSTHMLVLVVVPAFGIGHIHQFAGQRARGLRSCWR